METPRTGDPPGELRPTSRRRVRSGRVLAKRVLALAAGALAAVLCAEVALRALQSSQSRYCVWQPFLERSFFPDPAIMPGVSGESRLVINSLGLRGDEPPRGSGYQVLCVGGSTTECLYLDQTEAWPQLLQAKLRAAVPAVETWVANAGRSGHNTRHHVLQLQYLLPQLPDLDALILLAGANDVGMRLAQDAAYDRRAMESPEVRAEILSSSFQVAPLGAVPSEPWYRRTAWYHLARSFDRRVLRRALAQDDVGAVYVKWRKHRSESRAVREELPDVRSAVEEYRRNLTECVDRAQSAGIRVVLLTQPCLWQTPTPADVEGLLWMGGVGEFQKMQGAEYYAAEALAQAMDQYNRVVLDVADQERVECVDLAAELPRDTSVFYDDVHFNEGGARRVAEILARYLLDRAPFRSDQP